MPDFDFATLVTDRAPADLEALRDLLATPMADWTETQLAAFNQAISKGAYNYTDLNRVTACMDYLNERLTALGYVTGYRRVQVPHEELPAEDENTLLLIHGDSISDASIYNVPITNNGVTVSQAQIKFGGGSLYFNGESSYLTILSSSLLYNLQYFTADWWEYRLRAQVDETVFHLDYSPGEGRGFLFSEPNPDSNEILTYISTGDSWDVINGANSGEILLNQWVHRAVVRNGNQFLFFENGVLVSTDESDLIPELTEYPTIGMYQWTGGNQFFYGYISEFRVSNVARWTSNFTPPTEPYDPTPGPEKDPYKWYEQDVPTVNIMQSYLNNLNILRSILPLPQNTVATPTSLGNLSLESANNVEKILDVIGVYLTAYLSVFIRSDMPWAISGGPIFYFMS